MNKEITKTFVPEIVDEKELRFDEIAIPISKSFVDVGNGLAEIKKNKLYKSKGYETFEQAVKDIWNYSKAYANQVILAANTYNNLAAIAAILPTAESQIRPLTTFKVDKQIEVWQEASKKGTPTAKQVKDTIVKLYPPNEEKDKPWLLVHKPITKKELLENYSNTVDEANTTIISLQEELDNNLSIISEEELLKLKEEKDKAVKKYNFILEQSHIIENKAKEDFNAIMNDYTKAFNMLSKTQQGLFNE